jgi:hypothetical protein
MKIQDYFAQSRKLYVAGLLLAVTLGGGAPAFAEQGKNRAICSDFLPADARPVASLHLCRSGHDGRKDIYACQDFRSSEGRYRVMFKGGHHPQAIAMLAVDGEAGKVLWSRTEKSDGPVCSLTPPPQAPATNQFISAGVCTDDAGQSVPCAVFRRKAPRAQITTDYLVFYQIDGSGPHHAIPMYVDTDPDALPAELAFQIGRRLIRKACCQHRGLQYLQYAAQLDPDSTVYRATLEQVRGRAFPLTTG